MENHSAPIKTPHEIPSIGGSPPSLVTPKPKSKHLLLRFFLPIFIVAVGITAWYLFTSTSPSLSGEIIQTIKNKPTIELPTKNPPMPAEKITPSEIIVIPTEQPDPPTPTPETPKGWITHEFPNQQLIVYTPSDWQSRAQDYSNESSTLIRFWKKDTPTIVPVQLEIKPNWNNTGNAKDLPREFLAANDIPSVKVEPPQKTAQQLERYQTNYYFERLGEIYVFQCVHNWAMDYVDTCDKMVSTMQFSE